MSLWEEQAAVWTHWARQDDDAYWMYRDEFFALVPEPGERTLDIGCGEGRVSRDLAARGHRVVGVDSAPTLVEAAQAADAAGEYVVTDAASLPFPDGSFDLATAYNSLMDIDDMESAVREAWRVLRPGSRFVICVTHPVNDAGRFEPDDVGGPFFIDTYRGRRRYDETFERYDSVLRFVGWCYPLEGYTRPLEEAGFLIEAFREPPFPQTRLDEWPRGERRRRIPNFLMMRAVKPT
jgi:ubiquinone/menaquinone biosynthesis C-methylase UbiE